MGPHLRRRARQGARVPVHEKLPENVAKRREGYDPCHEELDAHGQHPRVYEALTVNGLPPPRLLPQEQAFPLRPPLAPAPLPGGLRFRPSLPEALSGLYLLRQP